MDKMITRGRFSILLQEAPKLSKEWGGGQSGLLERHMATFKELSVLSRKYGYDANHNLRYLALSRIISRYQIKELLVLGCGKGILEGILPEEVSCTSIDINPEEIKIAKEINLGKKNRNFVVFDILKFLKDSKRKYQAVLISEVLEHLKDDKEIIQSISGVIEPNKGLFLLTVPNINRFVNNIYPFIGRKCKFMSNEHLREYKFYELYDLLASCGFRILDTKYSYFRFPKEDYVRKIVPVDSRLRELGLKVKPDWADYIITVSSPS